MAGQSRPFGAELRRRREDRRISLGELSRRTHYSKGHLGNVEKGVRLATLDLAWACDRALGAGGDLAALVEPPPGGLSRRPPRPRRPWRRPGQLPADVADFTGRTEHLRLLDALLADDRDGSPPGICAVVGTPGVGKTALAVHWAHRNAERFPDGQIHLDLHGFGPGAAVDPGRALERVLRGVGVPAHEVPSDLDEAAAAYRSLLDGRRVLVVLDDAASAEQVRPLLPGSPGCLVLVTSRERLGPLVALHGARRIDLDVLDEAEAVDLLGRIAGTARVAREPAEAAAVARLCAGLPLAVRIAAAAILDEPGTGIAEYAARLRGGDRLARLSLGGEPRAAVEATLDLSYSRLDPAERLVFRRLGLVPGPDATPEAAAALAGTTVPAAATALDRLAAVSLLDARPPGRYRFHSLLRLYAAARARDADTPPQREQSLQRLFDWYARTADQAARLLYPGKVRLPHAVPGASGPPGPPVGAPGGFADHGAALAWLDGERPNLVAATAHAAGAAGPGLGGLRRAGWLLADALRGYFWASRHTQDWLAVARCGLAAARTDGDLLGQAGAALSLADARWSRSDHQAALVHYRSAADLAHRGGWPAGRAAALANLGNVHQELGELDRAVARYREALEAFDQAEQPTAQAATLANLGAAHHQRGRLDHAAAHYGRALELHRSTGDQYGQALTLNVLGVVHRDLGHPGAARDHLERALALSRRIGDRYGQARALENLAAADCDAGRYERAFERAGAGLALARETGDRRGQAAALTALAEVHHALGRHHEALATYQRALRLAREIASPGTQAEVLVGTALAHLDTARPDHAVRLARHALALSRQAGYRVVEGRALAAIADAYRCQGRPGPAAALAEQALAVHRECGHLVGQARALRTLGHLRRAAGDRAAAAEHWRAARNLFAEAGADPEARGVAGLLGPAAPDPPPPDPPPPDPPPAGRAGPPTRPGEGP